MHHVCQVKLHLNYFQITNQYSPFTKHRTFHYNVFHSFLLITFSCLILSYFIQGTVKCCISKSKSRNNGSSLSISPSYFNFIKPSPSSFLLYVYGPCCHLLQASPGIIDIHCSVSKENNNINKHSIQKTFSQPE